MKYLLALIFIFLAIPALAAPCVNTPGQGTGTSGSAGDGVACEIVGRDTPDLPPINVDTAVDWNFGWTFANTDSCTWGGTLPGWASINQSGRVTGTPTVAAGATPVTVTCGAASDTFNVTIIDDVNAADFLVRANGCQADGTGCGGANPVLVADSFDDIADYQTMWAVANGGVGVWPGSYGSLPQAYPNNRMTLGNNLWYPSVKIAPGSVSGAGVLTQILNAGASGTSIGGLANRGSTQDMLGAGVPAWPETIPADTVSSAPLYAYFWQKVSTPVANFDWSTVVVGAGYPKMFVFGDDTTCNTLELYMFIWGPSGSAGSSDGCGTGLFYWEQLGGGATVWGENYPPLSGHVQNIRQSGPMGVAAPLSRTINDDFACMRDNANPTNCYRPTPDEWTFHAIRIYSTPFGQAGDELQAWVFRDGTDPHLRQWQDSYDGFDKSQAPGEELYQNFLIKGQPDGSLTFPNITGIETEQYIDYDDLIIAKESRPLPAFLPDGVTPFPVGPHTVLCGQDGTAYLSRCPEHSVDESAISLAARRLSPGAIYDGLALETTMDGNAIAWNMSGFYTPTTGESHYFGKPHGCTGPGCWTHRVYDHAAGTWSSITAGIGAIAQEGHIYDSVMIDQTTGEMWMCVDRGPITDPYYYNPATRSWSQMGIDIADGEATSGTPNGCLMHPDAYGPGDGALFIGFANGHDVWRFSTQTAERVTYGPGGDGDREGPGQYFPFRGEGVIGGNGTGEYAYISAGSGGALAALDTNINFPFQVRAGSIISHLPMGHIFQHPYDITKLLILEREGANRVYSSVDGNTWTLESYTHPFNDLDQWIAISHPQYGVFEAIGEEGGSRYHRLWKPDS